MALDDVNSNRDLLPGYQLKLHGHDSGVSVAFFCLNKFFPALMQTEVAIMPFLRATDSLQTVSCRGSVSRVNHTCLRGDLFVVTTARIAAPSFLLGLCATSVSLGRWRPIKGGKLQDQQHSSK